MRTVIADATLFNLYTRLYADLTTPEMIHRYPEETVTKLLTAGDGHYLVKAYYGRYLIPLINTGSKIVHYVLAEKVIPAAESKKFEKAAKALTGVARVPNKPYAWWLKNKEDLAVLIDADRWKDKDAAEDTGLVLKVKGFDIINQAPKLKEKDYDLIIEDFKKAITMIDRSGVVHSKSLYYGNCIISPEIDKKNVLAFYSIKQDALYLKPSTKERANMVQTIIHEVGHRLWNKFLSAEDKSIWKKWHMSCEFARVDVAMPSVGDTLPVKVGRGKDYPIVSRIEGDKFYLEGSGDRFVTFKQLYPYYQNSAKFPSTYSATNEEEHFCEAFSFYCLGTLQGKHVLNFEALFKR